MIGLVSSLIVATAFVTYPGLGDRPTTVPRAGFVPRVEMTIDKGPIIELAVRCRNGTTIVAYSKIERVYCGVKGGCAKNLQGALSSNCR